MARREYPPEFRRRVVELVEGGRKVAEVAAELGISGQSIYTWRRQAKDRRRSRGGADIGGEGRTGSRSEADPRVGDRGGDPSARHRTVESGGVPKRRFAAIRVMAAEGLPVEKACQVLAVSVSGYYGWLDRPLSARAVRHAWLTELITKIHVDSKKAYGARRVHAELTLGHGIAVGHEAVAILMRRAGMQGLSGRPRFRKVPNMPTASDLVDRQFHRDLADRLWVTDITEHPTREGKVYCAVVLDTFSRRVVGWSIDSSATATLVTNALGMAIDNRQPTRGETLIHSDQGTQFTSWAFTQRAVDSGLVPSMGSIGDCFDNAVIESFWSRMQVELLNTRRWKTRVELATAIFEYLEIWHNRQRRHSSLGMLTPVEFEARHQPIPAA